MANPFTDLQARLAALLRAHAYFADLAEDALLTEAIGDLDYKITSVLLPLGFGVVITTAKGDGTGSLDHLASREQLTVAIIHNPTLDPDHAALDALAAAIAAIHGRPLTAGLEILREDQAWAVTGHERRLDAPPELHVHHLFVAVSLHF